MSLGSAVWLTPMPLYALGPLEGLRIRRLISRVARYEAPAAIAAAWAGHATPGERGAATDRVRRSGRGRGWRSPDEPLVGAAAGTGRATS